MAPTQTPDAGWWRRFLAAAPKMILATILIFAILDLLAGVFLRYVAIEITDYFDMESVGFFWVEELGELALAWLALIGAALGILERTHFALAAFTHRLPQRIQNIVERVNHLLIAGFGALAAVYGWKLSVLNATLFSPGLEISLAWLYLSAVVGGALMAFYGLGVALGLLRPRDIAEPDAI